MSFGSLSGPAVEALNRGAEIAGCLQSTGEGGVSSHHLKGGDLVWQIGTGYFGCREPDGRFSMARLKDTIARAPQIRAIEIKLSQGAKPGVGGVLPRAKITRGDRRDPRHPDRSRLRQPGRAQRVPERRRDARLHRVDRQRNRPAGRHQVRRRRLDVLGGPGARRWRAARAASTSSRSTAAKAAPAPGRWSSPITSRCRSRSASAACRRSSPSTACTSSVVFIGSGKLGFPEAALLAFALGCDMINVGREAMMAIGCIQAQQCHTNHCPTGVATQNPWLVRGLDPTLKAARLANYIVDAAQGPARAQSRVRRAASGAHHRRSARAARRPFRRENGRRALWLRPRIRTAVGDRLRRSAPPDVT